MAKRRKPTPSTGSHEVASGDVGDHLWWNEGYDKLSAVQAMAGLLWELADWNAINWDMLLKDLPRLAFLRWLGPEEFFDERAWDLVDGFVVLEPLEEETTGSASGEWTHITIEMDHNRKEEIFRDCDTLCQRLEAYPPLKPFLGK